jgi:hypothetical protein
MDDRQYVYYPTASVNGDTICGGYPYSLLDWVPKSHQSWSLSVNIQRVPSSTTAVEIGITQVKELSRNRADLQDVLDIVAADDKYGNAKFLRPLQGLHCGIVVRMRRERVMYQTPMRPKRMRRVRPRIHGKRFVFKKSETWGDPYEDVRLEHPRLEHVKLERWDHLLGKNDVEVPVDVIRASIHLERDKPPQPIWLAWQAPAILPHNMDVDAKAIWEAYVYCWPVEPNIRFRKQLLGWTTH